MGKVRNRTVTEPLHLIGALTGKTKRPHAFGEPSRIRRNDFIHVNPGFAAWKRRLPIVSVSTANTSALVILLVEDDFFLRSDLAGCLRQAGYAVIESANGEEAIEHCRHSTFDIVITDINLGGSVDGWDVAKCFRSQQPDVPVVYMSGQAIDRERCVPGSVFVAKPYQQTSILRACSRLRSK